MLEFILIIILVTASPVWIGCLVALVYYSIAIVLVVLEIPLMFLIRIYNKLRRLKSIPIV